MLEQPFKPTDLTGLRTASSTESRPYASLYREAISTNSPSYQFLCLYKIIESIRERRARLTAELKLQGLHLERLKEIYPSTEEEMNKLLCNIYPHLNPAGWSSETRRSLLLPEIAGRKFNNIFDDFFRPIRIALAHVILDEGELKHSPDNAKDQENVAMFLPALKCIVRSILRTEFPDQFDTSATGSYPGLQ